MTQNNPRIDVPTTPTPRYLTIAEAVSRSGISLSTVRRALASGALPHSRFGLGRGGVRIDPSDLAKFLTPRPAPRRADHGFTLIELLVVVVIIGILAGIAIPVFLNQKAKAHDAAVVSQASTVAKSIETALVDATGTVAGLSTAGTVSAGTATQAVVTTQGVQWAVDGSASAGYCIAVWTTATSKYSDTTPLLYDSTKGGLLPAGQTCATGTPVTWSASAPAPPLPAVPVSGCTVHMADGSVDPVRTCSLVTSGWYLWGTSSTGGAAIASRVMISPAPTVTEYTTWTWVISAAPGQVVGGWTGPAQVLPGGWAWTEQAPVSFASTVAACTADLGSQVLSGATGPNLGAAPEVSFTFGPTTTTPPGMCA